MHLLGIHHPYNKMSKESDTAELLSHFGEALGAGFESVLESIASNASRPAGGVSNMRDKKKRSRSKPLGGGARKRYKSKSRKAKSRRRLSGGAVSESVQGGVTTWIEHVKAWAQDHNVSYGEALRAGAASWRAKKAKRY